MWSPIENALLFITNNVTLRKWPAPVPSHKPDPFDKVVAAKFASASNSAGSAAGDSDGKSAAVPMEVCAVLPL